MGLLSIIGPRQFLPPCLLQTPTKHATGLSFIRRESACWKPPAIKAKANTRKESAKVRNRRLQRRLNGSPGRPRLSVFCSKNQLYAMLVDDEDKKCLFYGSTLQKAIRGRHDSPCTTVEAARRVGEELIKACTDLNINEVSSYDRNGCSRGERMQAFETAISQHGFMPK